MTGDRTVGPAEACWLLAGDRITEVIEPLKTITNSAPKEVENPFIDRRNQIEEFLKTALSRVSDAAELLEQTDNLHYRAQAVEQLLLSTDVFLEATQDLLVRSDDQAISDANEIGSIRETVDKIQGLVTIVAEEARKE